MRSLIFLFVLAIPLITSCEKKLDRDDARKMIIEKNNFPQGQNYEIFKSHIKDMNTNGRGITVVVGDDKAKEKEQVLFQFEAKGLLSLKETPKREETNSFLIGTTIRTWKKVDVTLTDLGKRYLIREDADSYLVNLWHIDIKEITGIRELPEMKIASVDYLICNKDITPFGEIFSDKNSVSKKTAEFSLYDNGWRIN